MHCQYLKIQAEKIIIKYFYEKILYIAKDKKY